MWKKTQIGLFIVPLGLLYVVLFKHLPNAQNWLDRGVLAAVCTFLIAFSVFAYSIVQDSPTNFTKLLFKVAILLFGVLAVTFLVAVGYVVFVLIPADRSVPRFVGWIAQAFYGGFIGFLPLANLVRRLRRRKGSVWIKTDYDEYKLGDVVNGTVHVKLKKNFVLQSLDITLCGYTRERRYVSNQPMNFEEEHFARKVTIDMSQTGVVDNETQTKFSFKLSGDDFGCAFNQNIAWKINAHLNCSGLDLENSKPIIIWTPEEYEAELARSVPDNGSQ